MPTDSPPVIFFIFSKIQVIIQVFPDPIQDHIAFNKSILLRAPKRKVLIFTKYQKLPVYPSLNFCVSPVISKSYSSGIKKIPYLENCNKELQESFSTLLKSAVEGFLKNSRILD